MGSIVRGLLRGAAAGAAGTTALTTVSGIDAAVTARPASTLPEQLVARLADDAGVAIPGGRKERARRTAALGPLAGIGTGIGLGAATGAIRAAGLRLPTAVGGPLLGAAAMATTDGALAVTGLSDPRSWTAQDWTSDVLPHLVYGVVTHRTLTELDRDAAPVARPSAGTLARAAAVGAATGSRSAIGLAAWTLTAAPADGRVARAVSGRGGKIVSAALALGEMGADKHPAAPSRLETAGLTPRLALGATTAGGVAQRRGADPDVPALVGAAAALGAAVAGVRLRAAATRRFGSDLPGALAEDAVAALLAWWGTRRA